MVTCLMCRTSVSFVDGALHWIAPVPWLTCLLLCFDTFFVKFNLLDVPCITASISKLLSYAIIAGAILLKLPQIMNIVSNKDTRGLASMLLYLDVASFLPSPAYNILNGNDFATYGEACIVLVENILVVLIFWYFSPTKAVQGGAETRPSLPTMAGIAFAGVAMMVGLFSMPQSLWWTMPSIGVIFTIGGVPQIYTNFVNGHTGHLSVITWLLNFVGALARVLTTLKEPGISESSRPWLIASFGIGASLSAAVLIQIALYWSTTKKVLAKKSE